MIKLYIYDLSEISTEINDDLSNWSMLWYEDLEEAGIVSVVLAWDGNDIVAFQSINCDNRCVAIEVKDSHQGQGISRLLIEESGCYKPERNENPSFWEHVAEVYA